MAEATAKFKAKLHDRKVYALIARELMTFSSEFRDVEEGLAEDAELIFAGYALKDTGRMAKGIRAVRRGDTYNIEVEAKDPDSGFDYVRVTRFGHVVSVIYPGRKARSIFSQAQYTASDGPRRKPIKGAKALRTRHYGFQASVRGFKPQSDWAEPAYDEVRILAQERLEEFGEGIAERIGRGT